MPVAPWRRLDHRQVPGPGRPLNALAGFTVCTWAPIPRADGRALAHNQKHEPTMNPEDPESAQRIVAEYARVLEDGESQEYPAPLRTLPYPKQTIKTAILTCAASLREAQQLTGEMREFLEQAYVALADYLDDDLVRVMAEYREALASVADVQSSRDKQQTPAWQRIAATSRLAGEIARAIADDMAALRQEFRAGA